MYHCDEMHNLTSSSGFVIRIIRSNLSYRLIASQFSLCLSQMFTSAVIKFIDPFLSH